MAGERSEQLDLFGAKVGMQHEVHGGAPEMQVTTQSAPVAPVLAKPIVAPSFAAKREAIQDAGAELVANRRNKVRTAQTWADLAPLNDALRVKNTVKGNVWPKPDYAQLIAGGMKPLVAHVVKQVYDSVASKPVVGAGRLLDDGRLENYVRGLNQVERGLMAWASDNKAVQHWVQANIRSAGAMLGRVTNLTDLVGESRTLLDSVFPDGWKLMRSEVQVAGGNKLLGALQPGYEEVRRAMKALDAGWPEKREAWEVQGFRVVENPVIEVNSAVRHSGAEKETRFYVSVDGLQWPLNAFGSLAEAETAKAAIGPFVLFGKRGVVDSFSSHDEAVAVAKMRSARDKSAVIGEKGEKVEGIVREGVARRLEGEDISSERLMTEFGFKGVNFGNWMKTPSARAEAQLHLNHAFDALHDLAEVLDLPPKAMSLNGMIGLAIGAQGAGGTHAAHFVAGVNEINLTRVNGAGSLTHEWGHALDHYFGTLAGLATATEPFLTEHAGLSPVRSERALVDGKWVAREVPRFSAIRPEMLAAFKTIAEVMDKREQSPEEAAQAGDDRLAKSRKSLDGWLRSVRRDFVGIETEFDLLADRVRSGDLGDGHVAVSRSVYLSPVIVEMRALFKQKHGHVYSLDNSKAVQGWADAVGRQVARNAAEVEHVAVPVPSKVATDFATNARKLDEEKGGKPYWSTKLEKFARAFDAFVSDELDARGIKNGYLAHQGRQGVTVPMGAERTAVNAAFRGLVGEVKTRETERGVALFSLGGRAKAEPEADVVNRDGNALFSAESQSVGGGILRAEMDSELLRMRGQWPSMPKVTVVDSINGLPFSAPSNCDGAYYRGEVFVVAENVDSLRQFHKVMAHECVLHHSLEDMLGNYGFSKLHSGIQALKASGDKVVCRLAAEVGYRYGELSPEDETREIVARAGEYCLDDQGNLKIGFGFMKSVFSGMANWLRDHGIPVPFTNVELQGLMHDAGQWVRTARGVEVGRLSGNVGELTADGVLHSFAGIRAENAPLEKLRVAREMQFAGAADRDIWKTTGWTFGFADGKPRFELADDGVVVEPREQAPGLDALDDVAKQLYGVSYGRLPFGEDGWLGQKREKVLAQARGDLGEDAGIVSGNVRNSLLVAEYPVLGEMRAHVHENDGEQERGGYSLANGISAEGPRGRVTAVVMHELQHAVQDVEGFARGGSPDGFKTLDATDKVLAKINDGVQALYSQSDAFYRDSVKATQLMIAVKDKYGSLAEYSVDDPLVQDWWAAIEVRDQHPESSAWFALKAEESQVRRDGVTISASEQYHRLAGEVEARLTGDRIGLSAEERAGRYPVDEMDVPVAEQAVAFRDDSRQRRAVCEGQFSGKILDVANGLATQKVGRGAEVVLHSLSRLSEPVRIGDVVDIAYCNGRGAVGVARGVER